MLKIRTSHTARALAAAAALALSPFAALADLPVANTPSEVVTTFESLFHANDLDAMMTLYEDDSIMLGQPGTAPAEGPAAIRPILEGFTSVGKNASIKPKAVLQTGDTALVIVEWSMSVPNQEGAMTQISGTGTEVVRQRENGTWYYLIDNPFGVAMSGN